MFNPLLMIDFYKSTHHEQYPVGLTKMVSYYTPRMSRLKDVDKVTLFGLQAFIKEYLIEGFNDNFFNRPEEEVVAEYERVLNATLGPGAFQSAESAIKSSAGWCLSFLNTATVPAIMWLEKNYNCDCTKEPVAYGAISTEHSVMCSNYAVDGNEITHIRRLLTEIYPHHNFSMVSDSYDYWNLVEKILPHLKDEIMAHDGCLSIRGDSGDPVEIIAGKEIIYLNEQEWENLKDDPSEFIAEFFERDLDKDTQQIFSYNGE